MTEIVLRGHQFRAEVWGLVGDEGLQSKYPSIEFGTERGKGDDEVTVVLCDPPEALLAFARRLVEKLEEHLNWTPPEPMLRCRDQEPHVTHLFKTTVNADEEDTIFRCPGVGK